MIYYYLSVCLEVPEAIVVITIIIVVTNPNLIQDAQDHLHLILQQLNVFCHQVFLFAVLYI